MGRSLKCVWQLNVRFLFLRREILLPQIMILKEINGIGQMWIRLQKCLILNLL